MPAEEYVEPLTEGLFRERRVYLGPEAWGDPGDGIAPPTDLIREDDWMHIMDLPTHVVLETTDHFGSAIRAMNAMSYAWICAIDPAVLEASDPPFVFDAYLDVHDEFAAAPFVAMHGWYRQGTADLRNALEVMTNATRFAVRGEVEKIGLS